MTFAELENELKIMKLKEEAIDFSEKLKIIYDAMLSEGFSVDFIEAFILKKITE